MLRSWSDFISFQTLRRSSVRARNSCMLEGKSGFHGWKEMICCFTLFLTFFCLLSLTSSVLILYFLLFLSTHNILMSGGDQLWLISCVSFAVMLNSLVVPPSIACLRPFTETGILPSEGRKGRVLSKAARSGSVVLCICTHISHSVVLTCTHTRSKQKDRWQRDIVEKDGMLRRAI